MAYPGLYWTLVILAGIGTILLDAYFPSTATKGDIVFIIATLLAYIECRKE